MIDRGVEHSHLSRHHTAPLLVAGPFRHPFCLPYLLISPHPLSESVSSSPLPLAPFTTSNLSLSLRLLFKGHGFPTRRWSPPGGEIRSVQARTTR